MKQLPKGAVPFILILALVLFGYVLWQLNDNNTLNNDTQYLDELNIETDNPQPAGLNITR